MELRPGLKFRNRNGDIFTLTKSDSSGIMWNVLIECSSDVGIYSAHWIKDSLRRKWWALITPARLMTFRRLSDT